MSLSTLVIVLTHRVEFLRPEKKWSWTVVAILNFDRISIFKTQSYISQVVRNLIKFWKLDFDPTKTVWRTGSTWCTTDPGMTRIPFPRKVDKKSPVGVFRTKKL